MLSRAQRDRLQLWVGGLAAPSKSAGAENPRPQAALETEIPPPSICAQDELRAFQRRRVEIGAL